MHPLVLKRHLAQPSGGDDGNARAEAAGGDGSNAEIESGGADDGRAGGAGGPDAGAQMPELRIGLTSELPEPGWCSRTSVYIGLDDGTNGGPIGAGSGTVALDPSTQMPPRSTSKRQEPGRCSRMSVAGSDDGRAGVGILFELEVRMPVPRCRPAAHLSFRNPVAAAAYPYMVAMMAPTVDPSELDLGQLLRMPVPRCRPAAHLSFRNPGAAAGYP